MDFIGPILFVARPERSLSLNDMEPPVSLWFALQAVKDLGKLSQDNPDNLLLDVFGNSLAIQVGSDPGIGINDLANQPTQEMQTPVAGFGDVVGVGDAVAVRGEEAPYYHQVQKRQAQHFQFSLQLLTVDAIPRGHAGLVMTRVEQIGQIEPP